MNFDISLILLPLATSKIQTYSVLFSHENKELVFAARQFTCVSPFDPLSHSIKKKKKADIISLLQ